MSRELRCYKCGELINNLDPSQFYAGAKVPCDQCISEQERPLPQRRKRHRA